MICEVIILPFQKQTFYDCDILSSLLTVDNCSFLKKIFLNIKIPKQVYNEIMDNKSPKIFKKRLNKFINDDFVKVIDSDFGSSIDIAYQCILKGYWAEDGEPIGRGEAAVIAYAIENDGIVASNNLSDVLYYTEEFKLPLLTSSMILAIAVSKKIITKQYAEGVWAKMDNSDRILPAKTFSKYFNEIFPTDFEKYYKSKIRDESP